MKRALICFFALACAIAWAEEPALRVFTLKPGNLYRVRDAVRLIAGEKNVSDDGANTVVVKTLPEYMPAVEKVVKELDQAPAARNIEMTFYILQGLREPLPESAAIPPELQATVAQLKSAFGFQEFRVFDTAVLRVRDGQEGRLRGSFLFAKDQFTDYDLSLKASVTTDTKPAAIRFHLYFGTSNRAMFDSSIDVKEGQKVVIGKSGISGNQSAIILVCTSRLVD